MQRDRLTLMGERIHLGMVSVGITTESALARRVHVSRQTVRRLLYDPVTRVDAVTLFRLADTIKLSARWIVHGSGSPSVRTPVTPSAARLIELHNELPPMARGILLRVAAQLLDVSADGHLPPADETRRPNSDTFRP